MILRVGIPIPLAKHTLLSLPPSRAGIFHIQVKPRCAQVPVRSHQAAGCTAHCTPAKTLRARRSPAVAALACAPAAGAAA